MKTFPKDLIAASTTPILLSILRSGPDYGYSIIQKVRVLSDEQLEWKDGVLYPVLHKLEDKGLVRSEWHTQPNGKKRKYYSLTSRGHKVLEEELDTWKTMNQIVARIETA